MIGIRRLGPSDWRVYRTLRLAALADAPDAFGSTLERAAALSERDWRERLEHTDPDVDRPLVATLDAVPCALAWAVVHRERPDAVELFQMWVSPPARGRGIGRRLVDDCVGWAASRGRDTVVLGCTRDNAPARRLYERCGFVTTGATEPLREGSDVVVVLMERRPARTPESAP